MLEELWNDKAVRIGAAVLSGILLMAMIGAASAATVVTATSMFDGKRDGRMKLDGRHYRDRDGRGNGPPHRYRGREGNEDGESSPGTPGMPGLPGIPDGLGSGLDSLEHGDIASKDASGKSITKRFVRGTVTAVRGATVTVKAADGYTANFVVTESTRIRGAGASGTAAAIPKGSTALAIGTVAGKVVKADFIAVD